MRMQGEIDFEIVEQTESRVVAHMPIINGIKNPFGTVHAGAILWFADVAATVLALESPTITAGMQGFPLAISLNANFLGNQQTGTLIATATYVKKGKSVSVIRTLVTGEQDKMLAEVTTSHVRSS